MENKANAWKSESDWQMKDNNDSTMFYIKKTSSQVVLGETNAGKVVQEDFFEDNPGQLWVKGTVYIYIRTMSSYRLLSTFL